MKILIVCATAGEGDFLPGYATELPSQTGKASAFLYKNLELSLLITGVGMVATTYFLQLETIMTKYDLIINIGLAGCFKKDIALGTVFNVHTDCFSEAGAEDHEDFISVFDLGLEDPDKYPFTGGRLIPPTSFAGEFVKSLPGANAITVNKVHGHDASVSKVRQLFHPDVESMEGAAFFYVCMMAKIPCLQIRAISNVVERRNRNAWNLKLALENLKTVTLELLDKLAESNK